MTRCVPAVLLLAWCAVPPAPARAQEGAPVSVERTGGLGRAGITESSGVAVSRAQPGVLWTHEDSSHEPLVYAIDVGGRLLATVRVVGARSVDWEDIALGACPPAAPRWRNRACLYVGDTGDNGERRTRVVIYVVPEPQLDTTGRPGLRETEPALALRVRYQDRPHDAEALAVDSRGNVHIITKGRTGPILRYVIPPSAFGADSVSVVPHDTLPVTPLAFLGRLATGAAVAPGGAQAVVRTMTEIYFFKVDRDRWELDGPACRLFGLEPQGEGVDYLDGRRLVLTSERGLAAEGVVTVVQCR